MDIRNMQDQLYTTIIRDIEELSSSRQQNAPKPGTKAVYREAQAVKWRAKRIARMAYAIEVLESIEPRYGDWNE